MRVSFAAKMLAAALVLSPVGGSGWSAPEFAEADAVPPVEWAGAKAFPAAALLVDAPADEHAAADANSRDADHGDAAAPPDSAATSAEQICVTLETSATANLLPIDFFTRLIWQESGFNPRSVSRAGAQGIAQFMPATARSMGLPDPFDPIQAIGKAAELLRELRARFGNLGLAAAAYNAGPKRVVDWLAKRVPLPRETQAYVRVITGRAAEEWTGAEASAADATAAAPAPCLQLAARGEQLAARPPVVAARKPELAARIRLAVKVVAKKPAHGRVHLASASAGEEPRRAQSSHRKSGAGQHSAHARKLS